MQDKFKQLDKLSLEELVFTNNKTLAKMFNTNERCISDYFVYKHIDKVKVKSNLRKVRTRQISTKELKIKTIKELSVKYNVPANYIRNEIASRHIVNCQKEKIFKSFDKYGDLPYSKRKYKHKINENTYNSYLTSYRKIKRLKEIRK